MSKRSHYKIARRKLRRALNKTADTIKAVGNSIHRANYGSGVDARSFGYFSKEPRYTD